MLELLKVLVGEGVDHDLVELALYTQPSDKFIDRMLFPQDLVPEGLKKGDAFYIRILRALKRPDSELAVVRLALRRFGKHRDDCASLQVDPGAAADPECSCGFRAALRKTAGDELLTVLNDARDEIISLKERLAQFARPELFSLMSSLSSLCYGQLWQPGVEFDIWDVVEGRSRAVGEFLITTRDINRLKELSSLAGGWVVWDHGNNCHKFLPLDEWKAEYAFYVSRDISHAPDDSPAAQPVA